MQPRIKMGLIVGAVGLLLNICVSGFVGLCGPFASLLAGGVAGYIAASQERLPTKSDGAKAGGVAGAIVGVLMIAGQVVGGVFALIILQNTGKVPMIGTAGSDSASQITYYLSGMVAGVCIGIVGAAFAAAAGAGAGYVGTPDAPAVVPPQMPSV